MMKGIIYGLMQNYHRQNTKKDDYNNMAQKLFQRHEQEAGMRQS
jgi:hypothetical protein